MFEALIREVASRFGLGDKAGPLLQMLLAFIANKQSGGLSGFIDLFKRAGMGDIISSWLGGSAAAKPISGPQLETLFGGSGGLIQAMASRIGIGSDKVTSVLSFLLPAVIGKLTPGGTVPASLPDEVTSFIGPAGSWLSGLTSSAAGMARESATAGAAMASAGAVAARSESTGIMRWLPWVVAAAVVLWLLSMCTRKETTKPLEEKPAAGAPAPIAAPAPTPAPTPAPAAAGAPPAAKIYFEVGKAELPAGTTDNLKAAVDYLKANPASKAVVSGFHDPTGNKAQNEELAKSRALAVRGALTASGVGDGRIVMEKPVETTGSGGSDAEARRVEVAVRP